MTTPAHREEENFSGTGDPEKKKQRLTAEQWKQKLIALGAKDGNATGPKAVILPGSAGPQSKPELIYGDPTDKAYMEFRRKGLELAVQELAEIGRRLRQSGPDGPSRKS